LNLPLLTQPLAMITAARTAMLMLRRFFIWATSFVRLVIVMDKSMG
jgi:hypothetical protein